MARHANAVIVAAAMALLITACNDGASSRAEPEAGDESMSRHVIVHDGIEREYFVHVPPGGDGARPVVLAIHGYTSTATGFQLAYDLNTHADRNGYIVVYPQSSHFETASETGDTYRVTSWNDLAANSGPSTEGPHCIPDAVPYPCPPECGSCNRCGWTSCYDDMGFIVKVLDEVEQEFATDPQRYYVLGVSNGGMLAFTLGCRLSDRFAAVAPVIAQLAPGYACGPTTDLPMLHLFGGKDNTVRADGLPGGDGFIYTSAARSAEVWAEALSCATGPVPWENEYSRAANLSCTAYTNCRKPGTEVVSCQDPEGGHDWPAQRVASMPATCVTAAQSASMPGQSLCPDPTENSAHGGMDLVWHFFSRYRRDP